jgi:hypothetical protein
MRGWRRILVQFMAGGNVGERIGYQTGGFEAVDSWKENSRSRHNTRQSPPRSEMGGRGGGVRRSRCKRSGWGDVTSGLAAGAVSAYEEANACPEIYSVEL